MTPKEQKIKEAYGEYWDIVKDYTDENGWCDFTFTKDTNILIPIEMDFKFPKGRPINLKGIANNNGWIKVESEADLPKETIFVECISKAFDFKDKRSQCTHHFMLGDEEYMIRNFSHYRTMPFNPPIY